MIFKLFLRLISFSIVVTAFLFNGSVLSFTNVSDKVDKHSLLLTDAEKIWLKQSGPIKIGVTNDWHPFEYIDISGNPSGINVDIINMLAQKVGLQIELHSNSWQNNLASFKDNDLDILMGIRESSNRRLIGNYSMEYMQGLETFFTLTSMSEHSFTSLSKKRVAIPKNFTSLDYIDKNYPLMSVVEVDTLADAVDALTAGRVELIYDNYHVIKNILEKENIHSLIPIQNEQVSGKTRLHFLVQKQSDVLLSIINKMLASLSKKDIDKFAGIHLGFSHTEYTNENKIQEFTLTKEEQLYLKENQTINFTGDPNWLPYEGLDKDGNYVGIVPDFLDIFEEKLGIIIHRDIGNTWKESVDKYKQGKVQVISDTSNSSLTDNTVFSDIYLSSPIVMLMRDTQSYVENVESIDHLQLSVISDYGYVKSIKETYPNQKFTEFSDLEKGIKGVATGKTDVLFATLAQASYQIGKLGSNNVRIVGSTELTTGIALGVHSSDKTLVSIFNKVLSSIPNSQKQEIINRWGEEKFVSRVDHALVFKVLLAAIFIIILIIIWYQRLLREINARQEAQAQYKVLLDLLPTQVMIIDIEGRILSANRKVFEDYEADKDTIIGSKFVNLLSSFDSFTTFINDKLHNNRIDNFTLSFVWPHQTRTMMLSMEAIMYKQKEAYLALVVDISERVIMENAIIQAKNAAIEANEAKSSFLANMSHEIRTPMNAIIGFTELLSDQVKERRLISYVKTIRSAGNSLLLLINDILDFSKIEANKVEIQCNEIHIHRMIQDITNVFEIEIKNKNLDFIVKVDENVPSVVMLDEVRLRQVLFNLIGNAVKFTNKGKISLEVKSNKDSSNVLSLSFSIIDTGIGIDKNEQEKIFNSFTQPKEQSIADYGGTGLGLTISKRLLELMSSKLSVISEVGQGSTFTFTLPNVNVLSDVEDVINKPENIDQDIHFNDVSILVVDDVEYNRQLLVELLPRYGVKVDVAINGLEAVEKVKLFDYSLVFLDIRMPKMNGYEAATIIKTLQPNLPIVAFTASILASESEIMQRDIFDGLLKKPVLKKDVLKELKKHVHFDVIDDVTTLSTNHIVSFSLTDEQCLLLRENYLQKSKELIQTNNINEISNLIKSIKDLAISEGIHNLIEYCSAWQIVVDDFEVVEIQQYGQRFIEVIK